MSMNASWSFVNHKNLIKIEILSFITIKKKIFQKCSRQSAITIAVFITVNICRKCSFKKKKKKTNITRCAFSDLLRIVCLGGINYSISSLAQISYFYNSTLFPTKSSIYAKCNSLAFLNKQNWTNNIITIKTDNTNNYKLRETRERGSSRGVVANVLDCDIILSEFEHQSHNYVHFRTNTLGKGINPLIPPAIGWRVQLLFYESGFGIT